MTGWTKEGTPVSGKAPDSDRAAMGAGVMFLMIDLMEPLKVSPGAIGSAKVPDGGAAGLDGLPKGLPHGFKQALAGHCSKMVAMGKGVNLCPK